MSLLQALSKTIPKNLIGYMVGDLKESLTFWQWQKLNIIEEIREYFFEVSKCGKATLIAWLTTPRPELGNTSPATYIRQTSSREINLDQLKQLLVGSNYQYAF